MKVLLLVAATGVCWLATAGIAAALDGPQHWLPSGVAALLCLLPAIGTLVLAGWSKKRTPVEALGFVLIAPIVRLVLALGGGVIVGVLVPDLRAEPARFALWGAVMYLVVLVGETALLLAGSKGSAPQATTEPRGG